MRTPRFIRPQAPAARPTASAPPAAAPTLPNRWRRAAGLGLPLGLLGLVGLLPGQRAQAAPKAVQVATWDRESNPLIAISEALLTRAYADIAQAVAFIELPARRAGLMLARGEVDANVHRAQDFAQANPQLLWVSTPLNRVALRVYTREPQGVVSNWADLARLRVAHIRGVVRIEQLLPAPAQRVEAASLADVWRLLSTGTADVAVVSEMLRGPGLAPVGLRRLEVVLDEHTLHHMLGPQHSDLARRLNAALQRLQASGEAEALRQATLLAFQRRPAPADSP